MEAGKINKGVLKSSSKRWYTGKEGRGKELCSKRFPGNYAGLGSRLNTKGDRKENQECLPIVCV